MNSPSAFVWLIGTFITMNSLLVAFLAYKLARRVESRRAFLDQIQMYYSDEVQRGVERLWKLYRESGNNLDKFLDAYMEAVDSESRQNIQVKDSLHFQRRRVSQFYRSLGNFLHYDLLPRKMVYQWWAQDDVDIVERLLIDVENRIARSIGVSELNPESEPLYYIVKNKHRFYKTKK